MLVSSSEVKDRINGKKSDANEYQVNRYKSKFSISIYDNPP